MPFRPPKKQPKFADLKGILAQTKDQDNALYQTIQILIERLTQFQDVVNDDIAGTASNEQLVKKFASKLATYHTRDNETSLLPNSVQLFAGAGIAFDDTIPNSRVISSSASSGHYDSPLTDGDLDETELIFALGDCIIVQVPI